MEGEHCCSWSLIPSLLPTRRRISLHRAFLRTERLIPGRRSAHVRCDKQKISSLWRRHISILKKFPRASLSRDRFLSCVYWDIKRWKIKPLLLWQIFQTIAAPLARSCVNLDFYPAKHISIRICCSASPSSTGGQGGGGGGGFALCCHINRCIGSRLKITHSKCHVKYGSCYI